MSFVLSTEKNKGKKFPLFKLRTKDKNKYVYYVDEKKSDSNLIDDLINEVKSDLTQDEKNILKNSIENEIEPDNVKLEKLYYQIVEKLKHKRTRFIVPTGKKIQILPDFSRIEKLYVCGVSGAGKSTFSSEWIKEYLKHYPKNEFYILSGVNEDDPLDKLDPVRIDLQNMLQDPITVEDEFQDSIVLFDDTSTLSNPIIRKMCVNLLDDIVEVGRHYNTTVINTSHMILDYRNSRKILNEATGVCIFAKAGSNVQNKKYLYNYAGLDKEQVNKILNLPSRWVYLKRTPPQMVIFEKGAYLL